MKHKRRFAALLAALALAAALTALPVLATQGDIPLGQTEVPGDITESEPVAPPTEEPTPVPPDPVTPEPPPVSSEPSSSSQEPSSSSSSSSSTSSEEPSDSSSESSVSSDPGYSSEGPWESESSLSSQEPIEEPSEDPWVPSQTESEAPIGGGVADATDPPTYTPGTIATPRPSLERPQVSLNMGSSSSSAEEESSGPNYVTFARLNVKGNSMAATLFYSGIGCIAAGVLGLAAILVFYIRGRRRYSNADGILEEIHEAEARQRPGQHPPAQELRQPAAPPQPVRPAPPAGAIMPEEASVYTEEFSLPPSEKMSGEPVYAPQDDYEEGYQEYRDDYPQDVYYEDEYYGDEDVAPTDLEQPYASHQQAPAPQPPVSQPSQDQEATQQFNTEEILREALRYYDEDEK